MSEATKQSRQLEAALRNMSSNFIKSQSIDIKKEIEELIQSHFDDERDPYNIMWQSRVGEREYPWYKLDRTGQLRNSFSVWMYPDRIEIRNSQEYSSFHMTGTKYMVARTFLPGSATSIRWKNAIKTLLDGSMKEILRGVI